MRLIGCYAVIKRSKTFLTIIQLNQLLEGIRVTATLALRSGRIKCLTGKFTTFLVTLGTFLSSKKLALMSISNLEAVSFQQWQKTIFLATSSWITRSILTMYLK
jgi:hypothetical protein